MTGILGFCYEILYETQPPTLSHTISSKWQHLTPLYHTTQKVFVKPSKFTHPTSKKQVYIRLSALATSLIVASVTMDMRNIK